MVLRYLTAGESHGKALVGILEGMPKGIRVANEDFQRVMALRWAGYGRGERKKIETDRVEVLSGLRYGITLGTPISLLIKNLDFENWREIMNSEPSPKDPAPPITLPRPGHADLAGAQKYHCPDLRDIIERASARETAMRVALSIPAQKMLRELGVGSIAFVRQIGAFPAKINPDLSDEELGKKIAENTSGFLCPDGKVIPRWQKLIDKAKADGDTLGGIVEMRFPGVPPGLGSHVQWDRRLDARLGQAVLGIPAVKAIEIGDGILASSSTGSKARDNIAFSEGRGFFREKNFAGGIEGGISNGETIVIRAFMKPIPTIKSGWTTEIGTHERKPARYERSDTVAVQALALVVQAAASFEIARVFLEKFGSDTLEEIKYALANHHRLLKKI